MRRTDREVNDKNTIEEIIGKADVVRIGLFDGKEPYIVPLNFGYEEPYFYMHCANEGRKIDIIQGNPKCCFELECDHNLVKAPQACGWSMEFKSVMGTGLIEIVSDAEEKTKGLTVLMNHYNPEKLSMPYDFSKLFDKTTILRLKVESMSCKVKKLNDR